MSTWEVQYREAQWNQVCLFWAARFLKQVRRARFSSTVSRSSCRWTLLRKRPSLRCTLTWESETCQEHSPTGPTIKVFFSLLFSLQVNFVACQLVALCAAFWFRIYLSPGKTSPLARHSFATIFGIYFVIFCFGWWVGASSILIVIIGVFCGSILGLSQVLRKEVYMYLE